MNIRKFFLLCALQFGALTLVAQEATKGKINQQATVDALNEASSFPAIIKSVESHITGLIAAALAGSNVSVGHAVVFGTDTNPVTITVTVGGNFQLGYQAEGPPASGDGITVHATKTTPVAIEAMGSIVGFDPNNHGNFTAVGGQGANTVNGNTVINGDLVVNADLTVTGNLTVNGSITVPAGVTLTVTGDLVGSGGAGEAVILNGTSAVVANNVTFKNYAPTTGVAVDLSGALTVGGNLNVENNTGVSSSAVEINGTATAVVAAKGDIVIKGNTVTTDGIAVNITNAADDASNPKTVTGANVQFIENVSAGTDLHGVSTDDNSTLVARHLLAFKNNQGIGSANGVNLGDNGVVASTLFIDVDCTSNVEDFVNTGAAAHYGTTLSPAATGTAAAPASAEIIEVNIGSCTITEET